MKGGCYTFVSKTSTGNSCKDIYNFNLDLLVTIVNVFAEKQKHVHGITYIRSISNVFQRTNVCLCPR